MVKIQKEREIIAVPPPQEELSQLKAKYPHFAWFSLAALPFFAGLSGFWMWGLDWGTFGIGVLWFIYWLITVGSLEDLDKTSGGDGNFGAGVGVFGIPILIASLAWINWIGGAYPLIILGSLLLLSLTIYSLNIWYSSPEQVKRRFAEGVRKSILNGGNIPEWPKVLSSEYSKRKLIEETMSDYLKRIKDLGSVTIHNFAREAGLSEQQVINLISFILKLGLIDGHFTTDHECFLTKDFIREKLKSMVE